MSLREETLVVIPALNEEKSIGSVVVAVREAGWQCLVIDDGSNDQTLDVARSSGAKTISLATNLGVGAALRAGFKFAVANGYQRIVQCDADGQHRPELIENLVQSAASGNFDLLIGSRFINNQGNEFEVSGHRRIAMRWLSWIIKFKTGVQVHDTTSGFRCISEPLLSQFAVQFPAHFLGDTFEACLVASANGYKVGEVASSMEQRKHGVSSASAIQASRHIVRSVTVATLGLAFKIQPKFKSL